MVVVQLWSKYQILFECKVVHYVLENPQVTSLIKQISPIILVWKLNNIKWILLPQLNKRISAFTSFFKNES